MDLILDAHLHTVSSGHAFSTVKEYAEQAAKIGLSLIAITDHTPALPGGANERHFRSIHEIRTTINGVEVLTGAELNILDINGKVDLSQNILKKLDVVIASLHSSCFAPRDNIEENTAAIINAMKNPLIKIIGHLGDNRYPIDLHKIVKAAKDTNSVIELNSSKLPPRSDRRSDKGDIHVIKELMLLCKSQEVPVLVSSDSHFYITTGDFKTPLQILNECNMPEHLVLNTSVDLFKNTLNIGGASWNY
jgi:putative hydrolase